MNKKRIIGITVAVCLLYFGCWQMHLMHELSPGGELPIGAWWRLPTLFLTMAVFAWNLIENICDGDL